MPNTILLKRSSVASAIPIAAQLSIGELAFNSADTALYTKNDVGNVIELTNLANQRGLLTIAKGGTGSSTQNFVDLTTTQSIAGQKTFTGNVGLGTATPGSKLQVSGGLAVTSLTTAVTDPGAGNLSVGGLITASTLGNHLLGGFRINAADANTNQIYLTTTNAPFGLSANGGKITLGQTNAPYLTIFPTGGAAINVGAAADPGAGNLSVGGGLLSLANNTSNLLLYTNLGVAAPTFTTRSAGTKIVLNSALSTTLTDYALGMESSTMWSSIPSATSTYAFKWYGGVTELLRLQGDGKLGLGTGTPGTRLQVAGGVAITSLTTAAADPGAGNLSVSGTITGAGAVYTTAILATDDSTKAATTAFVKVQGYAPLASPILTGLPQAPTQATTDNSTRIATTAYVKAQGLGLGFTPVQQGGGTGQLSNKTYIGWDGGGLRAQVDSSDLGNFLLSKAGILTLNHPTFNQLYFDTPGVAPPSITSRSPGTKITIYPAVGPSTVDYGIGMEGNNMWSSIPGNSNSYGFKWYGGTTMLMQMLGDGAINLGVSPSFNDYSNRVATTANVKDTITSHATYGFGTRSLSGFGYQRLPGGMYIQYGSVVVTIDTAGNTVITVPVTFPTNFWTVLAVNGDYNIFQERTVSTLVANNAQFVARIYPPPTVNTTYRVNYIAIGN